MRMRVGDLEMEMESLPAEVMPPASPPPAATGMRVVDDVASLPQLAFAAATVAAVAGCVALAVAGLLVSWFLLLPIPFLLRFAGYAAMLALRPRRKSAPPPHTALSALDDHARTVDEVAARLGWSERRTLEALVELIERGEAEEDLDLETGHWLYRRPERLFIEREVLPATERLEAIQGTRRKT